MDIEQNAGESGTVVRLGSVNVLLPPGATILAPEDCRVGGKVGYGGSSTVLASLYKGHDAVR